MGIIDKLVAMKSVGNPEFCTLIDEITDYVSSIEVRYRAAEEKANSQAFDVKVNERVQVIAKRAGWLQACVTSAEKQIKQKDEEIQSLKDELDKHNRRAGEIYDRIRSASALIDHGKHCAQVYGPSIDEIKITPPNIRTEDGIAALAGAVGASNIHKIKALSMRLDGKTYKQIADEFDVGTSTARSWVIAAEGFEARYIAMATKSIKQSIERLASFGISIETTK